MLKILNERIKEIRIERGLTQKDVAEHFHVTVATVSRWENGKREPSAEVLVALCNLLEVSSDYLLGRAEI